MFECYFYNGNGCGRSGKETLSVRKSGGMTIGQRLVERHGLSRFTCALLHYNSKTDEIAIKFFEEHEPGTVPIALNNRTREIRHTGFVDKHGIRPGEYHLVSGGDSRMWTFALNGSFDKSIRIIAIQIPDTVSDEDVADALQLIDGTIV